MSSLFSEFRLLGAVRISGSATVHRRARRHRVGPITVDGAVDDSFFQLNSSFVIVLIDVDRVGNGVHSAMTLLHAKRHVAFSQELTELCPKQWVRRSALLEHHLG